MQLGGAPIPSPAGMSGMMRGMPQRAPMTGAPMGGPGAGRGGPSGAPGGAGMQPPPPLPPPIQPQAGGPTSPMQAGAPGSPMVQPKQPLPPWGDSQGIGGMMGDTSMGNPLDALGAGGSDPFNMGGAQPSDTSQPSMPGQQMPSPGAGPSTGAAGGDASGPLVMLRLLKSLGRI
jgi:hypothetical protein